MRKGKIAVIWSVAVSAMLITTGFVVYFLTQADNPVKPVIEPVVSVDAVSSEPPSSKEEPPVKPLPQRVRLVGVGDNLIHEGLYKAAKKQANGNGYDFSYLYENIKEYIGFADIASINQETLMSALHEPSTYPMFNSPQELSKELLDVGFDVFNLANNHVYDKGASGLDSTLDMWGALEKSNGIVATGAYKSYSDFLELRTIERNDIVFSFLGMTEATNGLSINPDSELYLLRTSAVEEIEAKIKKAAELSDVVVVNVHWGAEYTHTPSETQKSLAKLMIEAGADIILGHHPHVIQPVEYIERTDGTRGVVAYSLGNFASMQDRAARMIGGALDITLEKDMETGVTTLEKVTFMPTVMHYGSGFSSAQVYLLSHYSQEQALAHGVKANSPEFSKEYIDSVVKQVINEEFLPQ